MNKKDFIAPILIIVLSFAFITICLLVFISNGKSKKWISRKMKVGAMLLSFSTISVAPQGCCYKPDNGPYCKIEFDGKFEQLNRIELHIETENRITGTLKYSSANNYSFLIKDSNFTSYQKGLIKPIDGKFDSNEESIFLTIDQNILKGEYIISFFDTDTSAVDQFMPFESKTLILK